jgi:hypothetical protein
MINGKPVHYDRDEVLGSLQSLLLRAIFSSEVLPGAEQPIRFPDLAFLEQQPQILVLDDHLATIFSGNGLPKPIKILSHDAILQEAVSDPGTAFLRFHPPTWGDHRVELNLEVQLLGTASSTTVLGLGGIQVAFNLVSGQWLVSGEPQSYAS